MTDVVTTLKEWAGVIAVLLGAWVMWRKDRADARRARPDTDTAETGARRARLELAQMIEDAAAEQVARISQRLQDAERRIAALERESDLLVGALAIQMEWADSGAPPPPPDIAAAVRAIVQRHRVLH